MGTTRSPCPYDAAVRHSLQTASLRCLAILRFSYSWFTGLMGSNDDAVTFSSEGQVTRRAAGCEKNPVERVNSSFSESSDRTKQNVPGAADAAALDVEPPMVLALRKDNALATDIDAPKHRAQVLARYRQLREISKQHHHKILDGISGDAFLHQARRLGLARGRTLILDDLDELNYVTISSSTPPLRDARVRSTAMPDRPTLWRAPMRRSSWRRCAWRASQFSPLSDVMKRRD